MEDNTVEYVNPVLLLLIRETFRFEIGLLYQKVTENAICRYLKLKRPVDLGALLIELEDEDLEIKTICDKKGIQSFLRNVYYVPDKVNFSKYWLDQIARSLFVLGEYKDWDDFVKSNEQLTEKKYGDDIKIQDLNELHPRERLNLSMIAQSMLLRKYHHSLLSGRLSGKTYNMIIINDDSVVRTIEHDELEVLQKYVEEKNVFHEKYVLENREELFHKNSNIYVLFKDVYDYRAVCSILPITNDTLLDLWNGKKFEDELGYFDIYPDSQKSGIKTIFITEFMCANTHHFEYLIQQLSRIIRTLFDITVDECDIYLRVDINMTRILQHSSFMYQYNMDKSMEAYGLKFWVSSYKSLEKDNNE
ncbi:MAG: hypothetical protein R2800_09465 [Flavipsychrobacter sp.]